jgi:hypothetical protein
MIHYEMTSPDHRIFVITDGGTFSAAQNFVNRMERWTNAVFVGEPAGSRLNFVGETSEVILPYSGLRLSISNRYWQDSDPGDDRPWVYPDVPAPVTGADYFANRDPALQAIFAIIERTSS